MHQAPYSFYATCPAGFEGVLGNELRSLGCREVRPLQGGVSFSGADVDAYRACLWSRTASRILRVVGRVSALTADALFTEVRQIDWPGIFMPDKTIAVYAKGTNDALRNTQFASLKVKDAICDSFRDAGMPRPSVDASDPDVRIQVTVHSKKATIYVDYAGESLHRRGYRITAKGGAHEAPIKEALAAGMLLWSGWDGRQFYDPVCGSGTLAIEAAMIATDMAPGLLRSKWGFEALNGFEEDAWADLVSEADERFEAGLSKKVNILGSDIDPKAVKMAESSTKAMGLGKAVRFVCVDCADMRQTLDNFGFDASESGLLGMNPPYGVRLLEGGMDAFYEKLGQGLSDMPSTWSMVAITPDPMFDVNVGMDSERVLETYNGPIEATVRYYELGSMAFRAIKVMSLDGREVEVDVSSAHPEQFAARLRKVAKQARKWAKRQAIGAYRIYDRDLPDFSLSVDVYVDASDGGIHLMLAEYKAPAEIDPRKAARRFNDAVAIAAAVFGIPESHVHVRKRRQDSGGSQYAEEKSTGDLVSFQVQENGHLFEVHMEGALDTGLFLDHRPIRKVIEAEAEGKRFLNLFAYTGAVSVYAAAGGASCTTTVDMNKGYLEWAKRNMQANGFADSAHRFVRSNVLEWVKSAEGEYDLVFVDPPTFSNSKSMGNRSWDIQRDHVEMLGDMRRILAPGAVVYFSGNLRSFKLDKDALEKMGYGVQKITEQTIPEDFKRNQKIHFCYRLEWEALES